MVAAIPAADRTAVARRLAISAAMVQFQAAVARGDFDRGAALWAELVHVEADTDFRRFITGRLGPLADSPAQRDIWRAPGSAPASARLGEKDGPQSLGDDLKRATSLRSRADRSRPTR